MSNHTFIQKPSMFFSFLRRHLSQDLSVAAPATHTVQDLSCFPQKQNKGVSSEPQPLESFLLRHYMETCQIPGTTYPAQSTVSINGAMSFSSACTTGTFAPYLSAPVILCIGTDRLIGDSLGPLTGSLLTRQAGRLTNTNPPYIVYGTLESTVHACNLTKTLTEIRKKHPGSVVLAVDASLSHEYQAGTVLVRPGSLKPGMGVRKDLPAAGDISITGITGAPGSEPYLSLQTTRLSLIMTMAEQICACIISVCCPETVTK